MSEQFNLILEELKSLSKEVAQLKPKVSTPTESEEIKDLAAAMAQAQGEFVNPKPNRTNKYYKIPFSDLDTLLSNTRPILAKNGIMVTQRIHANTDGQRILRTMLIHTSGQWMNAELPIIPPKNDIHTLGSYISYLKRISLSSMIGVATADEDDDGETAMAQARDIMAKGPRFNKKYDPKLESYETVTKEQLEELEYELQKHPDLAEEIMDGLQIQSIADMPKSKYMVSVTRIREIKNMRDGLSG